MEPSIKIETAPSSPKVESGASFNKESAVEKVSESQAELIVNKIPVAVPAPTPPVSDESSKQVDDYHQKRELALDSILSEGLAETFLAMPPAQQKIFKEEGEKTVKKINILLDAAKINIGKIAGLVRKWLSIIPGINRFFLDQEAKIKTDKIIKIKNKF